MTKVAILISGSGSNMMALVRDMVDPAHPGTACLVLSNEVGAAGLTKAAAVGVPTATVSHRAFSKDRLGFEAALQTALDAAGAEFLCLAGFMRVLTPTFVARWEGRILNIHPSLLPRHRGLETHARALAAGDTEHGCTVHEVTAELDDGPILGQARLRVRPGEAPEALASRVLALEHRLYPCVLRRCLVGNRARVEMHEGCVSD